MARGRALLSSSSFSASVKGGSGRLKGQIQQGVPGQHRHALAVDRVGGLPSPAVFVVVHAGQIVVYQGIGVDELNGRQKRGSASAVPFPRTGGSTPEAAWAAGAFRPPARCSSPPPPPSSRNPPPSAGTVSGSPQFPLTSAAKTAPQNSSSPPSPFRTRTFFSTWSILSLQIFSRSIPFCMRQRNPPEKSLPPPACG